MRRLLAEAAAVEAERRSRVLVVVDEPGLGKTRLADELRVRLPDWLHLYGACHPYGQRLPLAAVAQAIGTFAGIGPGLSPSSARRRVRRVARDARAATPGSAAAGLERQLETILGLHEATAAGDRAWSARRCGARSSGDRRAGHPGAGGRQTDDRRPRRRPLGGSGPRAAARGDRPGAMVRTRLVHRPLEAGAGRLATTLDDDPPGRARRSRRAHRQSPARWAGMSHRPVVSRLVARAAGNPLFLEESARMLVETRALVRGRTGWQIADPKAIERVPATLRLVVAARLDRLSTAAKATLQDASVAGSVTWDALLEAMAADEAAVGRRGRWATACASSRIATSSVAARGRASRGPWSSRSSTTSSVTWPTSPCRGRTERCDTDASPTGCRRGSVRWRSRPSRISTNRPGSSVASLS